MLSKVISISLILVFVINPINSEVPHQLSYQGRLTDNLGVDVPDGSYQLTFTIYDAAAAGNSLWSSGPQMVPVANGLFTYALGSVNPLPDSVFDNGPDRYLGTKVDGDSELTPRTQILSSAYAMHARVAELAQVFRLIPQDIPGPCGGSGEGDIYYDSVLNEPCYCDGFEWWQLDGGGPCDCVDLDADGYDICDPGDPRDSDGQPADCDDANSSINPGATEICNGLDDDCDGFIDTDDFSLTGATTWYYDADGDSYGDPSLPTLLCAPEPGYVADNTDCNDSDPMSYPGASEICDGLDNDCDSFVDEDISIPIWYADQDSDGFGDPSNTVVTCFQPPGYTSDNTDCDDADPLINPQAGEICDGKDNNCDGTVDEGC